MQAAFTEMPLMSEKSYLEREFGLKINQILSSDEFNSKYSSYHLGKLIIVSGNPSFWAPILKDYANLEVIFFLISNENYEPDKYNTLNSITNLKHVFIHAPLGRITIQNLIGGLIGNLADGGLRRTRHPGNVYREFRIAISMKTKVKKTKIKYSNSFLPIGYTNNFAEKISKLAGLADFESLIANNSLNKIRKLRQSQYKFSFLGQSSGRRREVYLNSVSHFDFVRIYPFEAGYGGLYVNSNDFRYVRHLLDTQFVLTPPGHLNSSNQRYTESLICGSIPVILACNSLDPFERDFWTNELPFFRKYSARFLVSYLNEINTESIPNLINSIAEKDFNKIIESKSLFNKLTLTVA